jgi:tRNA pseudouridine38-40 synthase
MARYQSILAYDGTDFHGFQLQAGGTPTVQAALEAALTTIGWRDEHLLAAGRTDAGVHAAGQVIAFDLDWNHDPEDLTAALNANLPKSIAVQATLRAADDFHPRFDARARHYRYRLLPAPLTDPLRRRYVWRIWPAPDLARMERLAMGMKGRHDFGAFGRPPIEGGQTVRRLFDFSWTEAGDELVLDVAGDAFLQHMVRRLAAAAVAAGQGQAEVGEVLGLLDHPEARWQGALAPAAGLCLMHVEYGEIEEMESTAAQQSAPPGG